MIKKDQEQLESWPGRNALPTFFLRWLMQPGEEAPGILCLHDAPAAAPSGPGRCGGFGKSWMLRAWVALARQSVPQLPIVQVDGLHATDQDGLRLTRRVVKQLEVAYPPWQARTFAATWAALEAQGRLPAMTTQARRERAAGEALETRGVRRQLWGALAQDLRVLLPQLPARGPTLLVIYDHLELFRPDPQGLVLAPGERFPEGFGLPGVKVVLVSRRSPDGRQLLWEGRTREILPLGLPPWSAEEIQELMSRKGLVAATGAKPLLVAASKRLAELTEGQPALLRLACEQLAWGRLRLTELVRLEQEAFEERLVARFSALEEPLSWWLLVLAHLVSGAEGPGVMLSWFAELLTRLPVSAAWKPLGGVAALRAALQAVPGVRVSALGESVSLQEELRRLLVRAGWERLDPDRRCRRDLSRAVAAQREQEACPGVGEQAALPSEDRRQPSSPAEP